MLSNLCLNAHLKLFLKPTAINFLKRNLKEATYKTQRLECSIFYTSSGARKGFPVHGLKCQHCFIGNQSINFSAQHIKLVQAG